MAKPASDVLAPFAKHKLHGCSRRTLPHPTPRTGWPLPPRPMLNPKPPENSGRGSVLRPLCTGASRKHPPSKETTGKRSRRSTPVQWAWLDLNQRPHPYQVSTAERHAIQPFRWWRHSVSPTGMGEPRCALRDDASPGWLARRPLPGDQSIVTTSHPLLNTSPEASETVQMMPWLGHRPTLLLARQDKWVWVRYARFANSTAERSSRSSSLDSCRCGPVGSSACWPVSAAHRLLASEARTPGG
jgi:hypothetical protein